jgi:antitoxin CptB
MSDAVESDKDGAATAHRVAVRRRQLGFRSWHRGTREMDLILGGFADRHLGRLTLPQLDRYAALLGCADPDLFEWLTGRQPAPAAFESDVLDLLRTYLATSRT